MRVITGSARGRRLVTAEGVNVRPTPDRVKEAVFSVIQFDIEGRRMLDLFAGSGQMGIEALSRGAAEAVFVDNSDESISYIKQNVLSTGFEVSSSIVKSDYSSFLARTTEKFDIAFLDPPYNAGFLADALEKVCAVIKDSGTIICEHPDTVHPPETVNGFAVFRTYQYGKIKITVYKKGERD